MVNQWRRSVSERWTPAWGPSPPVGLCVRILPAAAVKENTVKTTLKQPKTQPEANCQTDWTHRPSPLRRRVRTGARARTCLKIIPVAWLFYINLLVPGTYLTLVWGRRNREKSALRGEIVICPHIGTYASLLPTAGTDELTKVVSSLASLSKTSLLLLRFIFFCQKERLYP